MPYISFIYLIAQARPDTAVISILYQQEDMLASNLIRRHIYNIYIYIYIYTWQPLGATLNEGTLSASGEHPCAKC